MIDLEAVEKVNSRYRQIKKNEWFNILETWVVLKAVAKAAAKRHTRIDCEGNYEKDACQLCNALYAVDKEWYLAALHSEEK